MSKNDNRQITEQKQGQQQTQTLSPQQVLEVKLLQLTTVELEERVRAEVLENPALEEEPPAAPQDVDQAADPGDSPAQATDDPAAGEPTAADDYRSEDDMPDYCQWDYRDTQPGRPEEIPFSADTSFYEILRQQLGEQQLTPRQRTLCEYLVGSIEESGLLTKPLADIADELAIYRGIESDERELAQALSVIQRFDPPGIGARSLQECLLMQVERKAPSMMKNLQREILSECYEEFTRRRWDKIMQKLEVDRPTLDEAVAEIVKLNPRPGIALGESVSRPHQQIVPDFFVETQGDQITLTLNRGYVPPLRVSGEYDRMLRDLAQSSSVSAGEATAFIRGKIESARNFIDALNRREENLTVTMQAIVDFQRPFFLEGDESLLRPMILKDIADRTPYDISTVSRVSNSKYVQTNWGIYPLKFFFNDRVTAQDGAQVSVRQIHSLLRSFVDGEDKSNPLTDDQLSAMLRERGFPTARRTVAKYREQLHLPVARMRRK